MAELYLVRHAQGSFGSDEYDRLSAIGRRQAASAGAYFRRTLTQTPCIIAGSLRRQQDTAAAIGACFDVKPDAVGLDARLNEVGFDTLIEHVVPLLNDTSTQFRDLRSSARHDSRAYQQLLRRVFCYWQDARHTAPGIETWQAFAARVAQITRELMTDSAPGRATIAVTSGAIVAVAAQQALALPDRSAYGLFEVMMNASITRFLHDRRRISLASFNECSYLALQEQPARPGELRTYR